jgi:hypothetical protein
MVEVLARAIKKKKKRRGSKFKKVVKSGCR